MDAVVFRGRNRAGRRARRPPCTHCASSSFAAMQSVTSSVSSHCTRRRLGSKPSPSATPVTSELLLNRTAAPTGGRAIHPPSSNNVIQGRGREGEQTDGGAVPPRHQSVAVMLDFVNPARLGRRLVGGRWLARFNKPWRPAGMHKRNGQSGNSARKAPGDNRQPIAADQSAAGAAPELWCWLACRL